MARCLFLEVLGCMGILFMVAFFITVGELELRFWIILGVLFFLAHLGYLVLKRILKRQEKYNEANSTGNGIVDMDWEMVKVIATTVFLSPMHFVIFITYTLNDIWEFITFGKKEPIIKPEETIRNPFAKPPPPPPPVYHGDPHTTTYRTFRKKK